MYGAFVRQLRESRHLSQVELAVVSGVDQPNISAIENDRRTPSIETLNRLVVACGYELAAVSGSSTVCLPLPRIGWFPDEELPPRDPDDPVDESPTVTPRTPLAERLAVIVDVLDASSG